MFPKRKARNPGWMPTAVTRLACATLTLLTAAFAFPLSAGAARVSGTLTARSGQLQADRQIHFEDRVSHDIFLAATGPDGGFSIDLPPGAYDLRTESGAVISSKIKVGDADLALGKVSEPAGFNPIRLFELQGVLEGVATTPAPSTANLPESEASNKAPGAESATAAPPAAQPTATPSAASAK